MSRTRRDTAMAVTVLTAAGLVAAAPAGAGSSAATVAAAGPGARLPVEVPLGGTPNIEPNQGGWAGVVRALARVGNKVIVGGKFKVVKQGTTNHTVTHLLAIDATTKRLDPKFKPVLDGEVQALAPAPGGTSVLVGGTFNNVNGKPRPKLARLNLGNGQEFNDGKWKTPGVKGGAVFDIEQAAGRLYISGQFTSVAGQSRKGLAALHLTTGAVSPKFGAVPFTGVHNGGVTQVRRIEATPDGTKMFAMGNFRTVGGQERRQLARLNLGGASDSLDTTWRTTAFASACNTAFVSYVRDMAMSPDGKYIAIATTGGPYGTSTLCDSASRWETNATGDDVKPTWVNWTGGDTLDSVAISDAAVFVGGHPRWSNNPHGADTSRAGAVTRPGIAALDPRNGLPWSWNPGRDPRGDGAWSLLAAPDGLWVGSDTNLFGPPSASKFRGKIGFFPYAGGKVVPDDATKALPGKVYVAAPGSGFSRQNKLVSRTFDGTTAGPVVTEAVSGLDWSTVRGTMLIDGVLWYAKSDGRLYKRTFNGTALGPEIYVNPYSIPVWDADEPTWKGTPTDFYSIFQAGRVQGMFFSDGRMYYTKSGSDALYYRAFTPESGILGVENVAASSGWDDVEGMFLSGGKLYYVGDDGKLFAVPFTGGVPSGTPTLVSNEDWRGRGVFVG
ncbi:MAG TPA: hypothetical protein VHJ17_02345 [Thermomonospora sp.]|nr:hypothetical protein [Thermomonospora sp.]